MPPALVLRGDGSPSEGEGLQVWERGILRNKRVRDATRSGLIRRRAQKQPPQAPGGSLRTWLLALM